MSRLPRPGGDVGDWGSILNDFLDVAHDTDGSLKTISESGVTNLTTDLAATEKTANKGATSGYAPLNSSSLVPASNLGTGTASSSNYLRGDGTWTATPSAPVSSVAGKTGAVTLAEGDITNLTTDLAATEKTANKNQPSGYAGLDSSTLVPYAEIPTGSAGTASKVLPANDPSTTNARTPTAHASTHESGGSDSIRLDQLASPTTSVGLGSQKITGLANGSASTDAAAFGQIQVVGTTSGTVAAGDDSRIVGAAPKLWNPGDTPVIVRTVNDSLGAGMWNLQTEGPGNQAPDGGGYIFHLTVPQLMSDGNAWTGNCAAIGIGASGAYGMIVDVRYTGTGKATGKTLDVPVVHVWDIRDGKLARFRQFIDTVKFAEVVPAGVAAA